MRGLRDKQAEMLDGEVRHRERVQALQRQVGALLEGRGVLLRLERVAVGAGAVGEAVQAPLARMTAGAALLVVGASLAFASFSRQRMLELVERHKEAWRNPPAPVPVYDRYDSNSGRLGRPGLIRGSSSLGRSSCSSTGSPASCLATCGRCG